MNGKYYNHHPPPPQQPQSPPLPPQPWKNHEGHGGNRNLPSAIIATVILIFTIIIIIIIYNTTFRPKEPIITVTSIQFPSFTINATTLSFTFSQYASVGNPNRETFRHYDSSLQLLRDGSEVGFMFIPSGEIESGHTKEMVATFVVKDWPKDGVWMDAGLPVMEMESRMMVGGNVRVWGMFTRRVVGSADCRFAVAVSDGSVFGFRCS